jgi:hypothetical protein
MPPDTAAGAKIECAPVRWLATPLFALEYLRRLCDKWRIRRGIFPPMEADGVSQAVIH